MRCFICTFNMIKFGIPADAAKQIIQFSRVQNSMIEKENNEVFISIPALFKQYSEEYHGLILKMDVSEVKKIILLTPKIEMEIEIPDNSIHSLPKLFSGPFIYFNGVFFNDNNPVFIINTEKLIGCVK